MPVILSHMRILAFTSLLFISLTSCAKLSREENRYPSPIHWETKNFRVHFQLGPRGNDGRSFSFYQIIAKSPDGLGDSLVMESAHTIRGFKCVTNNDPKDWIRIIEDPSGKALVIEEEIPNDCAPCTNYLWITLDSRGFLEGTYLLLPSESTGNSGGIDYEYPKIHSVSGDTLKYTYKIRGTVSKSIQTIKKAEHPTPPG